MKKPSFSPPVMKIFPDKKPGFSKCIFTVKIRRGNNKRLFPIVYFSGEGRYDGSL
ncbi:Uncharacterized protein dnm_015460 [Desulfonema magnum]|uniref:Uncharacterized protein n=1 Tax=Desulfonema magnum TaxID=45655 RepID=A0A975BHT5_9BACT|nr:Uncharacterized protein dnm_015460 [Desulfonema magnum]